MRVSHVNGHLTQGYVHKGKIYHEPYYGQRKGRPLTFGGAVASSIFFIILGLFLLMIFSGGLGPNTNSSSSTYSYSSSGYNSSPSVYYSYDGGEFHRVTSYSNSSSYNFGNSSHSSTSISSNPFSSMNFSTVFKFAGYVFLIIGVVNFVISFIRYRKFQTDLQEIGDVNGDGVINIDDLKCEEKDKPKPIVKDKSKACRCQYCGSLVGSKETKCSSCGAKTDFYYNF